MTRPCKCGHQLSDHYGMFGDCLGTRRCFCGGYQEAPRFFYLRRVWRWLKAVPR